MLGRLGIQPCCWREPHRPHHRLDLRQGRDGGRAPGLDRRPQRSVRRRDVRRGGVHHLAAGVDAGDADHTNINATYSVGKALLGAEYTELSPTGSADRDAFLLLVDYDVSDKLGVAVRYSQYNQAGSATNENDTITVAPNYAITESLGAILEYSSTDVDSGNDQDLIALELTYTF